MTAFSSLVNEMKFFESAMLTLRASFPFPYIIFGKFFYYNTSEYSYIKLFFLPLYLLTVFVHSVLINLL